MADIERAQRRWEPEMEKHYEAIGVEADKIKPWNEQAEQEIASCRHHSLPSWTSHSTTVAVASATTTNAENAARPRPLWKSKTNSASRVMTAKKSGITPPRRRRS
jgi:hypothetical protein